MLNGGRIGLYSEAADGSGTDRIPFGALGRPSGIVFSTTWPGGDDTLTAKLELDSRLFQHRALTIGRRIRACSAGQTLWYGVLDVPDPDQLTCVGRGTLASRFDVFLGPGQTLDAIVDLKISQGLPWIRRSSLTTGPMPTTNSRGKLAEQMNAGALAAGGQWSVSLDGTVSMGTAPSSPSYVLLATDRPTRTAEQWVTTLYGVYIDSTSGAITSVSNNAPLDHGIRQDHVDLTSFGPMTAAQAQAYVNTLLGRCGYRASYTSAFTVEPGRLLTYPGGAPVDLAAVRAGAMVRPTGLDPSQLAETNVGQAAADFVIGASSYDVDSGVLALTPFEDATASTDLQSMVGDLIKYAAV